MVYAFCQMESACDTISEIVYVKPWIAHTTRLYPFELYLQKQYCSSGYHTWCQHDDEIE